MPQLTIYVSRELEDDIKRWLIPVSSVCQRALARQARIEARRANGEISPKVVKNGGGRGAGTPTTSAS